jgi:hypothetical protein
MNTDQTRKIEALNLEDLAHLGEGAVAYIREIEGKEAVRLLGDQVKVAPDARLYCLYEANGTPISISGTREAAIGSAMEHELMPMSVH